MTPPKNLGLFLLAIFLVVWGAVMLFNLSFDGLRFVLGGLAIAAGICILLGR